MIIAPQLTQSTIHVPMLDGMSEQEFFDLCQSNPEINFERDRDGNIMILSPAFAESGGSEASVIIELGIWNRMNGNHGKIFSSNAGFTLPNRAMRAPDASWILWDRWNVLSEKERYSFTHIAPDFVCEIRSRTDRLQPLLDKMEEYIQNGVRLGFLIDPAARKGWSYKPGREPVEVTFPEKLLGEEVLEGFELDLGIF